MKTYYPELPLIENFKSTTVSLTDSVKILLKLNDECLARAVFAVMFAEAARTKDKQSFVSAGEYNYSGVQTDSGRWGYNKPIVSRFRRVDVGGNYREFAGFKNNEGFFDFMSVVIKAKKFDGCNADKWTETYIQSWWSPSKKKEYTKGTLKFNQKKIIYETAMNFFDSVKKKFNLESNSNYTPSGFLKTSFFPVVIIIAIVYFLRK